MAIVVSPGGRSESDAMGKQNWLLELESRKAKSPKAFRVQACCGLLMCKNLQLRSTKASVTALCCASQSATSCGVRSGDVQSMRGGEKPGTPPGGLLGAPSQMAALPLPQSDVANACNPGRIDGCVIEVTISLP